MCLISALPKGTVKYGDHIESFIKSGASCNQHGSGFMYKREGTKDVHISKGYFKSSVSRNINTMIEDYKKLNLSINDEVVFHHRIGTQGDNNDLNTHPFFVDRDVNSVTTVEGSKQQTALAHNGIFSSFSEWELDKYSDTIGFARFMSEPGMLTLLKKNPKLFAKKIYGINSNKLAFIFPDRAMVLIGDFQTQTIEIDGINNIYYHSNSGYCRHVNNVGGVESENDYSMRFGRHTTKSNKSNNKFNNFNDVFYSKQSRHFNKTPLIKSYKDIEDTQLVEFKKLGYWGYKLNSGDIVINDINFRNFYIQIKENSKVFTNLKLNTIFEILSIEKDGLFKIKDVESDVTFYKFGGTLIHSEFNFIPKEQVKNIYRDYLYLDVVYSKPSKKFLKSIYRKLTSKVKKDTDCMNIKKADNLYVLAFKEYFNQNRDIVLGSKSGFPLLTQNFEITEGSSITNPILKLISYSADVDVNQELV